MNPALDALAKRVEEDPFFLASLLKVYADSEGLDDVGLAAALACRTEDLTSLRLCRAPCADTRGFRADVARIAGHFGLEEAGLLRVIRRAEALRALATVPADTRGMLLAARDGEAPSKEGTPAEGKT